MADTPGTAAGRQVVNDVREVVVHGVTDRIRPGYDLAWAVEKGVAKAEAEAVATDRAALRERVAELWHPGNGWVDRELVLTLLGDTPDVG